MSHFVPVAHGAWGLVWYWVAIAFDGIAVLFAIPAVLARRREPSVTLAWLLGLLLLPAVGVALFLVFGRGNVRRLARPRQRLLAGRRDAAEPADLEAVDLAIRPLALAAWKAAAAPVRGGNRVGVLVNANEAYPAKLAAIEEATRTLDLAYYIFRPDRTGALFRDALIAAARRGVRVRLLLDAVGADRFSGGFFRPLRAAGAEVRYFLPISPLRAWTLNLRNHRKILAVDRRIGFTGGINIGDEYLDAGGLGRWRDTHVRLEGPAVADLASVFDDDWAYTLGKAPEPPGALPEPAGESLVQILPSGPEDRGEGIYQIYFAAFASARRTIDITTPYFIPDQAIAVALVSAALRGVRVRLLVPDQNNQRLAALAARSYFDELLDAGVEIWRYTPGMIHAKTVVIDGAWASVGTANMDVRSFRLNFEVNGLLFGGAGTARLAEVFERDLAESDRLDPGLFRRRSLWWRAAEGGARLLSPIL